MKQFTIKSSSQSRSALELLNEIDDGYFVRIVHRHDGWDDVKEEFMTKDLFNTCLRTGYISTLTA